MGKNPKPISPQTLENFKKMLAAVKEKEDQGPQESCLSLQELSVTIFENWGDLPIHQINRIRCHLERCQLCSELIRKERNESPLYLGLQKHLLTGRPVSEYWDQIKKIIEEMKKGSYIFKKTDEIVTLEMRVKKLYKLIKFNDEFFRRVADFIKKNY